MEYLNFYPKTFKQIEDQDNPCFGHDECLVIFKESLDSKRYKVLYTEGLSAIDVKLGVFWKEEVAEVFCQEFNPEGTIK